MFTSLYCFEYLENSLCVHCLKQKSEISTYVVHWKLSISVSIYVCFCNQKGDDHMQLVALSLWKEEADTSWKIFPLLPGAVLGFCESSAKAINGRRVLQAWNRTNGWYSAYNKERKMFVLLFLNQKRTQKPLQKYKPHFCWENPVTWPVQW